MSVILWMLILSSGSVFGAACLKRKYEEMLPVTGSVLIVLLFLFGIAGFLRQGVYFVIVAAISIYAFSIVYILKNREAAKGFSERMFTSGFWIFVVFLGVSVACNVGRVASSWDEFSHWADIVKVMVTLDDFGTNPNAHSFFQSYPPAMTLFQYFLQRISGWAGGEWYTEWMLFLAYQVLAFSFIIPFAKEIDHNKAFTGIVFLVTVFLCPLCFFNNIYTAIYIDPFLGILSGTGFAAIFLHKEKDCLYSARIFLTCIVLVLSKDAGLMFAVLLALAYVVDLWVSYGKNYTVSSRKDMLLCTGSALLSVFVPKWIWSLHLKATGAEIRFSNPVDVQELFNVIFSGTWSYKRTVLSKYVKELFNNTHRVGETGIYLSYFWIAMLLLILLAFVIWLYRRKGCCHAKGISLFVAVCMQFALYVVGLVVMYMFKFSEWEALRLASMDRYMGIVFLSVWMTIVILALVWLEGYSARKWVMGLVFLGIVFAVTPMQYIKTYFSRQSVRDSVEVRSEYAELCSLIEEVVPETANLYIISQEDMGFDYWVLRYSIRPRTTEGIQWSIGVPFYTEDIWTIEMNAEQWMNQLTSNVDYVALYRINDYFITNFGECFRDGTEIRENMVYYVNKEASLLESCR